ncbi:hypothetical protein NB311A_06066 [Nitrobacter sp. Nb-311A]|uniref:hypothetical protein n=1 Tax=Nitrobacter sp. Nb-311A TaxID=314253 RepID=UPI00006852C2|nr:hypothetical protein [Nitrobacter sp. Nb-311A]EAQ34560.1 hypothetical protein NB311A_06066 [Nitrobacter sp. Nb-311A]
MFKLFDRVKVNIATTGTGDVTFGSASSNAFVTPTEAGAGDGDTVRYLIVDGTDFEVGIGTIKSSVAEMERTTVKESKIGGTVGTTKLTLSGTAVLSLSASAADILVPVNNLSDLDDADTALDNLGGTTVGKALFTTTDAAAALNAIGGINSDFIAVNLVVNPEFQIDQFGDGVGISTADNGYFADVYRYIGEAIATTYALLPGGGVRFIGTTDKGGVFQVVESIKSVRLRDQDATLSATLSVTNARIGNVKMAIVEWTGTADATTSDPVSSWGADGTTPTLNANWSFVNTPANLNVTTTPTRYSVTGTVGSSINNLALLIWNDDKSYTAGDGFNVTDIDLHAGQERSYRPIDIAADMNKVLRYSEPLYSVVASCYNTTLGLVAATWQAKRTTPSLALVTAGALIGNGTSSTVTSIANPVGMGPTGGSWDMNVASGLTAGHARTWRNGVIAVTSRL